MKLQTSVKYNIVFIFISHILMAFSAAWGVIQIVFYQDLNLDFFDISFIISFSLISSLIFETPTGIFADLYGRKLSVILSFSLCTLAGILSITATDLLDMLVIATLYGLSYSFWSGAFEALLYESLDTLGWRENYSKILTKSNFLFVVLGIGTNYYIPVIYEINMRYPFYITTVIGIVLVILSIFLVETEKPTRTMVIEHKFFAQIKFVFEYISKRKTLIFIFIYGAVWGSTLGIFGSLLNQPLIYEKYNLSDYGMIFSATTAIQSIIIFFTNNIIELIKKYNPYFILVVVWSLSLALMVEFFDNLFLLIPIMAVSWSVGTMVYILTSNDLNNIITDNEVRASVLSVNSMFKSFTLTIGLTGAGVLIETLGNIQETVLILSIVSLILGLFILFKYPKKDFPS